MSGPAPHAAEAPHRAISAQVLLRTAASWAGSPLGSYPPGAVELSVLRVSVPAGVSSDWHTNPTPVAVYVIAGELHIEAAGTGATRVIRAGEAFAEMREAVNRHGTGGPEGAELVTFFAGSPGVGLMGPAVD